MKTKDIVNYKIEYKEVVFKWWKLLDMAGYSIWINLDINFNCIRCSIHKPDNSQIGLSYCGTLNDN